MMNTNLSTADAVFTPLNVENRSLLWKVVAVVVGTMFLALMSQIEVPMYPVPMTMQTYGVMLVGALYGWRLGGVTTITWLMEGAAGLPVLAGGAGSLAHFAGPTAGYLFAFPICGMLVGWLVQRGWNGRNVILAFIAMLIGTVLCLTLGAFWLSLSIGVEKAMAVGVTPFLVGGVLKSALGAATLRAIPHKSERKSD